MTTAERKKIRFHALESRVRRTIRDYGMIRRGEHVVVAASGGADSTALLLCLKTFAREMELTLTAAHLNHCIRGAEGDADAVFTRRLCETLEIPCVTETIDVKKQAGDSGENLEACARRARYAFLRRAAQKVGAQKIAVGHNRNDQAETAIFRLLRGSGLEGLSAIRPVLGDEIARPLIDCSRELIRGYLKDKAVRWREDSTNAELHYARNRIRLELIPYLEKNFNPRLIDALARETGIARETWDFIEAQARAALANLCAETEEGISLDISGLLNLHPALQKQVLRLGLKEGFGSTRNIGAAHIENLLSLCKKQTGSGETPIPGGGRGIRRFGRLLLQKHPPEQAAGYSYSLSVPGEIYIPEIRALFRFTVIRRDAEIKTESENRRQALLELAALPERLTIRSRKPGDRHGGKERGKVKKMLIGAKIPPERRAFLPMLAIGGGVIWIPGFRPARGYEARLESDTLLLAEMIVDA
ncbi:MAG: tRNA lysidine(34) synthetase TilS [Acidobacteriota bacterium]|jgi:tRNA(Ile)-lysidine synthase|nr:tRNA lysidine(34) synthetase TilS [Acidobacteriota bacterium]